MLPLCVFTSVSLRKARYQTTPTAETAPFRLAHFPFAPTKQSGSVCEVVFAFPLIVCRIRRSFDHLMGDKSAKAENDGIQPGVRRNKADKELIKALKRRENSRSRRAKRQIPAG